MKIWGIYKPYPALSWWKNFMSGHLSIGPVTVYGANAMCWAVNIKTPYGYLCFTLPSIARKRAKMHHYIYLSPNGTPWAATWYRGSDKNEVIRAKIRHLNFGHGFSTDKLKQELRALNNKFSRFRISDYDVFMFHLDLDN